MDRSTHFSAAEQTGAAPPQPCPPDLKRLAPLVASGELPLPADITGKRLEDLVRKVREHRRQRLLQHIAGVVAIRLIPEN